MAHLPIQHLTLYKQGIGYFERSGTVADATVTLVVPRAGTNDVLKSLDVVTPQGGQVLNIDYETPEDKQHVLGALPVRLTDRASMVDLLTSLRGSEVTLTLEHDQHVHGRIIGIEASLDATSSPPAVLLQQEAAVQLIPLARLQGLT